MNSRPSATAATPFWSTSSFGDRADTTLPTEFCELGEHMDSCKLSLSRWFAFQCAGEVMNRFIAARFVTTLVVATVVMGITTLAP